jgi:RND family efflux transporter MFP subunit
MRYVYLQIKILFYLSLLISSVSAAEKDNNSYVCLIEPNQRIELRSSVEALIDKILVSRGSRVKNGQVLVELDAGVEQAALETAAYRSTMDGETKTAKTRLEYSSEKLERREALVKDNFISTQDRDDTLSEKRLADAELIQAKDNKHLAALEQKRLKEVLRLRTIKAPFDGIVTERLQNPGEIAFTGEGASPVLKIAQINPLRIEVILPLALYGKIKEGSIGEIVPEAPLEGKWQAIIKVVDHVVDSASGTFGAQLELPNPNQDIPAGVKCHVQFK